MASTATTGVPWPPPFTHFPDRHGDFLSGKPVPCAPTPDAIASMKTYELMRRVKVLRVMWQRTRQHSPEFCSAARAEAETLLAEALRRTWARAREAAPSRRRG